MKNSVGENNFLGGGGGETKFREVSGPGYTKLPNLDTITEGSQ